ncbi:PilZ domain-containing protein [Thermodesulfobacteriota bacterium]
MRRIKNNTKRNSKRFKVQNRVFMEIRGLLNLNCKIINISRGGLAFIYNDNGDRPGEKINLDLFIKKNGFQIRNLSARIISDSPVSDWSYFYFKKKRKCCAQFIGLIQNMEEQLNNFIKNYSGSEV